MGEPVFDNPSYSQRRSQSKIRMRTRKRARNGAEANGGHDEKDAVKLAI